MKLYKDGKPKKREDYVAEWRKLLKAAHDKHTHDRGCELPRAALDMLDEMRLRIDEVESGERSIADGPTAGQIHYATKVSHAKMVEHNGRPSNWGRKPFLGQEKIKAGTPEAISLDHSKADKLRKETDRVREVWAMDDETLFGLGGDDPGT